MTDQEQVPEASITASFARATDEELARWERCWRDGDVDPMLAVDDVLTALKAAYAEIDRQRLDYELLHDDYGEAVKSTARWQQIVKMRGDVIRQQAEQLAGLRTSLEERGGVIQFQRQLLQAMQAALGPETREKIADFKAKVAEGRI